MSFNNKSCNVFTVTDTRRWNIQPQLPVNEDDGVERSPEQVVSRHRHPHRRRHLSDRTDLNMKRQRFDAAVHRRALSYQVNVSDHETTYTTKRNHHYFLQLLVVEARRYQEWIHASGQGQSQGARRPPHSTTATPLPTPQFYCALSEKVVALMGGSEPDPYSEVLTTLSRYDLFLDPMLCSRSRRRSPQPRED